MGIILASGSPRRRELLAQIGITDFVVLPSDADESGLEHLPPKEMVEALALRKGEAVAQQHPDDLVLAADTVVALGDRVLGKPANREGAIAMLTAMSGRSHLVYTGIALLEKGKVDVASQCTRVEFRTLSEAEIATYVDTNEPMDKAGAYGIQGVGALLVSGIEGDYFNVMGLPLCLLGQRLAAFGVVPLEGVTPSGK